MLEVTDIIFIGFEYLYIFAIGAILGSFATAIIYRSQHNQSYIFSAQNKAARSKCPKCQHQLGAKDLMPILSWVFQNAKCRYCQSKISSFYPMIEITSAISALLFMIVFGFLDTLILLPALPFIISFGYRLVKDRDFDQKLFFTALTLCIILAMIIAKL